MNNTAQMIAKTAAQPLNDTECTEREELNGQRFPTQRVIAQFTRTALISVCSVVVTAGFRVTRSKLIGLAASLWIVAGASDPAIASAAPYRFQALTALGDPAPGGGIFLNDFEPTKLNNRGQLVFTAEPDGEEAVFLASGSTIQEIVHAGEPAPGGGTFSGPEWGFLGLNDAGDVAFMYQPDSTDPGISGLYLWSPLTQQLSALIVPNVTPVPGGGVFQGAYAYIGVSLNNRGTAAFTGALNGPQGTGFGAFMVDKDGNVSNIAQPGDPAPGGGTFVGVVAPSINDGGDAAFSAFLADGSTGLYVRQAATGRIEPLPLAPGTLSGFDQLINSRRDVVFGAFFPAADGPLLGLYLSRGGQVQTVVTGGQPAPGGGKFNFLTNRTGEFSFNNQDDVAFLAGTDAGDQAIYLYSGALGTLRRVAGIGTVVPGAGVITDVQRFGALDTAVALNDRGQIAFQATVNDGTSSTSTLILATPGN